VSVLNDMVLQGDFSDHDIAGIKKALSTNVGSAFE
jgi:hypothetical protein